MTRYGAGRSSGAGAIQEEWPPVGSHVVTMRRAYLHHGIYVGCGKVVHYSGLAHGLRRGPVEEVSLADFARGHTVRLLERAPAAFDPREIVRRARSRIGEDNYRLFTNNCEHFSEWCVRGVGRSYQVDAVMALVERPLQIARRFLRFVNAVAEAGRSELVSL